MESSEPEVVLEAEDLVVMYRVTSGRCLLTVFSQEDTHNLAAALGAIRKIALGARVRYQPAQNGKAAHILVEYSGEFSQEDRKRLAGAFVDAVRHLG